MPEKYKPCNEVRVRSPSPQKSRQNWSIKVFNSGLCRTKDRRSGGSWDVFSARSLYRSVCLARESSDCVFIFLFSSLCFTLEYLWGDPQNQLNIFSFPAPHPFSLNQTIAPGLSLLPGSGLSWSSLCVQESPLRSWLNQGASGVGMALLVRGLILASTLVLTLYTACATSGHLLGVPCCLQLWVT